MIKSCALIAIIVAALSAFNGIAFSLDCPSMPMQATRDAQGKVSLAVGRIGPIKGAELEIKAQSVTNDLLRSLPNADKVYLEQMMLSTYCSALRDDKALTESEKADRIKVYIDGVRKALATTGNHTTKRPSLSPGIGCKLEYPWKVENDGVLQKRIKNPEVTITNLGPIKAVSFSVDFKSYVYDVSRSTLIGVFAYGWETTGHLIFVKELAPSEEIKEDLNGFDLVETRVAVYSFTLKFYRETDMKLFTKQHMFFVENYNIFSEKDYSKNVNYTSIIKAIKKFKPSNANMVSSLSAVEGHTWLQKETPKTGIRLIASDRKSMTTSAIPDDPYSLIKQTYLNENRPVLYVRPAQFKGTTFYIDPKQVDENTVTISVKCEVENIGNAEATNVSIGDGIPYDKPIKPSEKIYLNWTIEPVWKNWTVA